jgi:hypothetical protein
MVLAAVPFAELGSADLHVDRIYNGGVAGNAGDDPLSRLVPVGNQGGFRYAGSPSAGSVRLVVLYTSGEDPEWPDALDPFVGTFVYYGDNKAPGRELHDTRRGNLILRHVSSSRMGVQKIGAPSHPCWCSRRESAAETLCSAD